MLSDPGKRAEYDRHGFAGVAGFSPEDLFSGIDFDDIFGGFDFGLGASGLYNRFFGHGHHRPGPRSGANVEVDLTVSLARIAAGGEEEIRFERRKTCPTCQGKRAAPGTAGRQCESCGGTGRQARQESRHDKQGNLLIQHVIACPTCGGRGELIEHLCPECAGEGTIVRPERLTINVPAGAEEGMALRIPGKGLPAAETRGAPGDLYVVVRSAPDPRFERDGPHLWRMETIGIADAALGAELTVPTIEGTATARVPPGTQPDTVLRLRGKGLPEFGSRTRGDLFLRLRVHVPERLSPEQKAAFERLRDLDRTQGKPFPRSN